MTLQTYRATWPPATQGIPSDGEPVEKLGRKDVVVGATVMNSARKVIGMLTAERPVVGEVWFSP